MRGKLLITILFCVFCFVRPYIRVSAQTPYAISTVAGVDSTYLVLGFSQYSPFYGDGGPATAAGLSQPQHAIADGAGNIYIADYYHNTVRKVDTAGIITRIAGNGSGTGLPWGVSATVGNVINPRGLAFDAAGSLYITSYLYYVVKINSAGILTLVAGTLTPSVHGDGGPATAAYVGSINDIAFDGVGNLYIAHGHYIRKVDTFGIITTIAGTGSFGFSGDGGPATAAQLQNPMGVAADAVGNIYIGDFSNHRVRKINTSGIITTIAGNGSTTYTSGSAATGTGIPIPGKLAVDAAGNVFVACGGTAALACKIDPAGIVTTIAGTGLSGFNGDGCNATTRQVYTLKGLSLDNAGNIYLADAGMHRIRKLTPDKLPKFTRGRSQSKTLCLGAGADTINTLLSVIDSDVSQSITWSVASGPAHGTLSASYSGTSTGGAITPSGLYYLPTTGYTGNDSFKIKAVDCAGAADTTTIYMTIVPSVSSVTVTGASALCEVASATFSASLGGGMWSSSTTGVAPVGAASGIVSGISAGSATITYSLSLSCGSATVYHTITVNPLPAAISGTASMCATLTTTFASSTSGGVWSSGSTAVATVGTASGVVSGVSGGISVISYTLPTGCRATKPVTVNPLPGSIAGAGAMCMGGSATFTSSPASGIWSSGSTSVATIGSVSGIVTPVSVGTATITYTLPTGCIATQSITVNPLPGAITGAGAVCVGGSATLTMTTGGGVWSASNAHAAISGSAGLTMTVTGVTAGIDTIAYTLPTGCASTKIITINPLPSTPGYTGSPNICEGSSTVLTMTSGSGGVWSSGATGIATVSGSTGLTMTIVGVSTGVASITYTLPTGCMASVPVTVLGTPAAITGTAGVCVGGYTALTTTTSGGVWTSGATSIATVSGSSGLTMTVNGVYLGTAVITYTLANGCYATKVVTVHPLPPAITGYGSMCAATTTTLYNSLPGGTWSSALPGIATAGSASGVITGVATGTATISYTLPTGCAATTVVTVEPSPTAITGNDVVCIGVPDTFRNTITGGTWASSDYGVAYVDAGTGEVIGLGAGVATISYTLGTTGCYRTKSVTVSPAPTTIGGTATVCQGNSATLTNAVPGGTWTSGAGSIATINPTSGLYTGVAAGVATMSYSIGTGCVVTRNVTVNPLPGTITGAGAVCSGGATTLTSSGTGTWASSNTAIAFIGSATGMVVGSPTGGVVTITYTLPTSCRTTTPFTVNPLPANISGAGVVCVSGSAMLTMTTTGGTWSSSSTSIATVSGSTGLLTTVTGVGAGTASISYILPTGCYTTKPITVNALPTAIIGAGTVCIGSSVTLSTGSTGGVWSRSNTNVTIGSSSGTVTGVASGTTVITYTLPTGCYATKTVTVGASGGGIMGAGAVCVGGSAVFTMSSGGSGTWSSSSPTVATIGSTTGLVNGITAGVTTISFTPVSGCVTTKTLTVNGLPAVHNVTGGGSYCASSVGLHVGLDGSAAGVTYQLYRGTGGSAVLTMTSGGGALDFGVHTAAGTYTVTATNTTTGCANNMSGSATISINPLPAPISGATTVCAGSSTTLATGPAGGTWTSSNTGVATIGSSTGVVNGLTIGSTVIIYTLPTTCSVTTTVNVSTAPTAITGAGTVCTGATTTLASTPTGGLWSSSNAARATVNSTSGEVTGVAAGTVTIAYSLGTGCIVTKTMTVMPSPAAITGTGAVCAGASTMLTSTTSGGIWSSSTTGIATVTSTGTVNGVTAGMAVISYTAGGCSTITIVTVNPVPAAIGGPSAVCVGGSVTETNTVTGGLWSTTSANINIGSSTGVVNGISAGTAGITYALGSCSVTRTITVNAAPTISGAGGVCVSATSAMSVSASSGTWSSSSMTTATLSGAGVVTGVNPGVVTITFTPSSGCAATKTITVNTAPTTITGTKSVCVGANTTLGNGAGGGVWSSGSTLIATINSTSGEVTGWVPGTANITYSLGTGCAVTAVVTVNPLPSAITGTAVMCVGSTTALSSGTAGGVWSSGSTGIATIATTGVVTGITPGTAAITYTNSSNGCSTTRMVTVTSVPDAISGANALCMGSTTILTNTTPGGTWTSSNPIVAAVSGSAGLTMTVSGVNTGTAVITYSLGAGCTVTKPVTVNPIPAGISGAAAICKGNSTTLATSAAGGTWITSGGIATVGSSSGVVTGVSGGAAIISYTLPTGCASTYTLSVVAVPAISGIHNMCAWGDTMTVSNGLTTGSYSSALATVMNLGGGVGLVTAHSPGTATIAYTIAGLGCSTTSAITVNPLPGAIGGPVDICMGGTGTMVNFTLGGTWSSSTPAVATIGTSSGAVAAIAGGTSTIVYTLPTGCKVDTVITVSTFPVAGTITGAGTVCSGATSALTTSAGSGLWSSSDVAIAAITSAGIITGVSSGAATITYTVTNVCGTAKAMKFITVNATPSAGVITGIDSLCVGSIVVLSNTATGGVWSIAGVNAAVTSTGTLSGLMAGVDTVYYTVTENGCTAMTMLPVRVLPITGCGSLVVHEIDDAEIRVFPNPSGGEFAVRGMIGNVDGDVVIEITDVLGQTIHRGYAEISNGRLNERVQLSQQTASGMYLLQVKAGGWFRVFSLVITR